MIDVQQLCYSIHDTPILANLTFSIPRACVLHIQAGNGAGKTTLLQLLCGLKQPDRGTINYKSFPIYDQLNKYQQQINYIGHQIPLQNQLSIAENWLLSSVKKEVYQRAVDYFELSQCEHFPTQQLSSGQRKKAVLMALILNPRPIWILDEPCVGLDRQSINKFWELVENQAAKQGLVILTSHQALPKLTCRAMSLQL